MLSFHGACPRPRGAPPFAHLRQGFRSVVPRSVAWRGPLLVSGWWLRADSRARSPHVCVFTAVTFEIFIPYTTGKSYTIAGDEDFDDEERTTGEEWYYVSRARRITNERSRAKIGITPAPLRGGEGGNPQTGDRVFQHVAGVSAPT